MDKLEEKDRFIEKFSLPWLNQEERDIMNSPITSTEIENVIKNLPKTKSPGPDGFTGELYQTFREELMFIFVKLFQKLAEKKKKKKKHLQKRNTSKLILWGHHHHDTKTKDNTKKENDRPITLMNIDSKILNKILANRIQ